MKYLQIGNENGGPAYEERYARFYDALRSRYPDLTLVACDWGGWPTSRPVEISDEHFYNNPRFFPANARRCDSYPRSGPRIFVGEYAVTSGAGNGNLMGALAGAAFLTGVERNADLVVMASYAPLFARLENKAWNPDLIYFNAATKVLTPSYHVQRLFARNRPDRQLPLTLTWEGLTPPCTIEPRCAIGLGSWNTQVEYRDVVVRQGGGRSVRECLRPGRPGMEGLSRRLEHPQWGLPAGRTDRRLPFPHRGDLVDELHPQSARPQTGRPGGLSHSFPLEGSRQLDLVEPRRLQQHAARRRGVSQRSQEHAGSIGSRLHRDRPLVRHPRGTGGNLDPMLPGRSTRARRALSGARADLRRGGLGRNPAAGDRQARECHRRNGSRGRFTGGVEPAGSGGPASSN